MKVCKLYSFVKTGEGWPYKAIALFAENKIPEKHDNFFKNIEDKARCARNDKMVENAISECIKYAKNNGIDCIVLNMPPFEFVGWEPWYDAGCRVLAKRNYAKLQLIITGLELYGYTEISGLFWRLSQDLNSVNRKGEPSLIYAAKRGWHNRKMYNALLAAGADPNVRNAEGKTALMYAVETQNGELIRELINHGALFSWEIEDEEETGADVW